MSNVYVSTKFYVTGNNAKVVYNAKVPNCDVLWKIESGRACNLHVTSK